MSESGDDSRTAAVGRKRKPQVSEGLSGARGVKSRRLSMASKESGEISSDAASRPSTSNSASVFSSWDKYKESAGQDRPQASFSLSGASRTTHNVNVSNNGQSNPLDESSSEEDGEIVESGDASTSMSESSNEEESEGESDSAPSHTRASASPGNNSHANEGDTSTMITKPAPDGMLRLHQLSQQEQDEQYKYFGLKRDNDIIYCMCCGDRGHRARICPTRRCTHCDAHDEHASNSCPTFRKCTRCRQRGHDAAECTNPQPIIIGNDPCDICGEPGHVEEECAKLWFTSLKPQMTDIRKLPERDMYKVCYNCGESGYDGHWGDDCPDRYYNERTQGPNLVKTWSKKDAAKFIGPDDDEDGEDERSGGQADQKVEDEEPAPATSRNWQVGLFDY